MKRRLGEAAVRGLVYVSPYNARRYRANFLHINVLTAFRASTSTRAPRHAPRAGGEEQ